MSNAKKCDRCGKLFEPYIKRAGYKSASGYNELAVKSCRIENSEWYEQVTYDLCEQCNEQLHDWLKGSPFSDTDKPIEQCIRGAACLVVECYEKHKGVDVECNKCLAQQKCKQLAAKLQASNHCVVSKER